MAKAVLEQVGAGPPFENSLSVRDVGGAIPPHEIRTPGYPERSEEGGAPRFRGDPGPGASIRAWSHRPAISGRRTPTRRETHVYGHLSCLPDLAQTSVLSPYVGSAGGRA